MPKAILEVEMPESCYECSLSIPYERSGLICAALACVPGIPDVCIAKEGRMSDCSLKLADEHCHKAEWVNGKSKGYQVSRWDDEPVEKCKQCKDFGLYGDKEVEP